MASAPRDGTHILVSFAEEYTAMWGPNQSPPVVVHWFDDGFYLSSGIIQGSTNDRPLQPKRWMSLDFTTAFPRISARADLGWLADKLMVAVGEYRGPPYRSSDWLAGQMMDLCEALLCK